MSPSTIDAGDDAWILASSVLVLGMIPGLALFQAGLLRAKNSLSIVSQVFAGAAIASTLFFVIGYSLVFDTAGNAFIGTCRHCALERISLEVASAYSNHISEAAHVLFQSMFASITPLLMTGAYAERLSFGASLMLTALWSIFAYYPVARAIWGLPGWLRAWGVLDFAGGIVIHTTSGVGALVVVWYVGSRLERGERASSIPLAAGGAALLWTGWMGFNGGSALSADGTATRALLSSQIAATVSTTVWLLTSWYLDGRPCTIAVLNGMVAGLAGVTPASGYIGFRSAFALGIVLGLVTLAGVKALEHQTVLDDALEVSVIHGLSGAVGSVAIGFLHPTQGLIAGAGFDLLGKQVVATVVAGVWAGGVTLAILWVMRRTCFREGGLRVSVVDENMGLDICEHGQYAYHNLHTQHEEAPSAAFHSSTLARAALAMAGTSIH